MYGGGTVKSAPCLRIDLGVIKLYFCGASPIHAQALQSPCFRDVNQKAPIRCAGTRVRLVVLLEKSPPGSTLPLLLGTINLLPNSYY